MLSRSAKLVTTIFMSACLLLVFFATFSSVAQVRAATLTVDTLLDENDGSCGDGDCSLRDALGSAQAGDTVSLPAGAYQLTLGDSLGPLVVNVDLTLTGVSSATTLVTNDGCAGNCGTLLQITDGATLNLDGVTLSNSIANGLSGPDGGGVLISDGHLIIDDAVISNNSAPNGGGGGVAVISGTLTLNGGAIRSNTADDAGGGVYLAGPNASFVMNGGLLEDNYTLCNDGCASGGAVYAAAGYFELTAGTIISNRADNGAAVYFGSGGGSISGGAIRENRNTFLGGTFGGVGGGIMIQGGTVTMSGGEIIGNMGRVDDLFPGGGVHLASGTFNMSAGYIGYNEAFRGGAVMVESGTFNFSGGTLEGNTANYGGAVYLNSDNAYMYQTAGIIASNTATTTVDYGGGAVFVTLGHYIGTGGEMRENFSYAYGGGVSVASGTASFANMDIFSNTAFVDGGLLHLPDAGAVVTITDNLIQGNMPNAVVSDNANVDLIFRGNDVSQHAVAMQVLQGRITAYANNFVNNTLAIQAAGNGDFDGRHNWFGVGATELTVGDSDAFAFRLGASRAAWSDGGSLVDSGNGRLATIVATSGSGTGIIISHGRGIANEPFATNAFSYGCTDYYDFFVVDGSVGSTWDVSLPIDGTVDCESFVAGGTWATNLLYKFATVTTPLGAPDTTCSTTICWDLWSNNDTITRSGSSGSYTLTADDVPLTELFGTPFIAGVPSSPTAISLGVITPVAHTGGVANLLLGLGAVLVLATTVVLPRQYRLLS